MVFLFKGLVQLQMKYMAQEKMIPTMDVFFFNSTCMTRIKKLALYPVTPVDMDDEITD